MKILYSTFSHNVNANIPINKIMARQKAKKKNENNFIASHSHRRIIKCFIKCHSNLNYEWNENHLTKHNIYIKWFYGFDVLLLVSNKAQHVHCIHIVFISQNLLLLLSVRLNEKCSIAISFRATTKPQLKIAFTIYICFYSIFSSNFWYFEWIFCILFAFWPI